MAAIAILAGVSAAAAQTTSAATAQEAVDPEPLFAVGSSELMITAGPAIGVVVFGVVTIVENAGQPQTFGKLDTVGWVMLGFGLLVGAQGIVLPGVLFRFVKPSPAMVNQFGQHGPEAARVLVIQSRIQTATIVGCALFEGGAFANLVWYMQNGELTHLAMAGLLLLGILARFPLPGACERRIADELRRQEQQTELLVAQFRQSVGQPQQPAAIDRPRQV